MDFLSRATSQFRELFESMSPNSRILAGLMLAVVALSLSFLFRQGQQNEYEQLLGGEDLPISQINRIEAAIAQAGLSGHRREGNQIQVPAGQKAAYLAAVADADALPPNFNTLLETALDKGGPWDSREATRERLRIAKQQTLSEIVRAMPWVQDAVVLYDEQEPRGLSGRKLVTGSVNVKPKPGEVLDTRRNRTLQMLVAHAVAGLKPESVAVTNFGDDDASGADSIVYPDGIDNEYYKTRIAYEHYKRQSILGALSDIPGVRVEVSADLHDAIDPTPKAVPLSPSVGSRHGTFAQGPAGNEQEAPAPQPPPSTPRAVRATVTIPRSYVESIWKHQHPDADKRPTDKQLQHVQDDVVAKVQCIVEPLLPRPTNIQDDHKQVRVVVLDCVSAPPPTEPTSLADQTLAWAGRHGSTLAVLGVAAIGLLVLRVATKTSSRDTDQPAPHPSIVNVATSADPMDETEAAPRHLEHVSLETPVGDDGATVARDDPSAAAGRFHFDDLVRLDQRTLAAVLREVDPTVMVLALASSSDELVDRITDQLPRATTKAFRRQLHRLGPTRLSDVESAQRAVEQVAAQTLAALNPHDARRAA